MQKKQKTKKTFRKGLTNCDGCDIILAVRSVGFENKQTPSRHTTRVRMVHSLLSCPSDGKCCVCGFCTHFFYFSWRYKAISTNNTKDLPINEEIKAAEVRVIGAENEQVGIMKIDDARNYAYNHGVDLVLIVPNATPPVCRAIDYGKFCFERDKREKEAKKKQVIVKVKEIQLSCRIEQHDFETRINHAKRFLAEGNKVKAVVRFKGREMSHMELGREVIEKFCDALAECGSAEKKPMLEGRFMHVIISPLKPEKK